MRPFIITSIFFIGLLGCTNNNSDNSLQIDPVTDCDISNCEVCNPNNSSKCLKCADGYGMKTGNQSACVENCADCLDCGEFCTSCDREFGTGNTCTACAEGYFLYQDTGRCLQCMPDNCDKCDSSTNYKCEICARNYGWDEDTDTCKNCMDTPLDCSKCFANCKTTECSVTDWQCTECEEGYTPDSNGQCQKNPCAIEKDASGTCPTGTMENPKNAGCCVKYAKFTNKTATCPEAYGVCQCNNVLSGNAASSCTLSCSDDQTCQNNISCRGAWVKIDGKCVNPCYLKVPATDGSGKMECPKDIKLPDGIGWTEDPTNKDCCTTEAVYGDIESTGVKCAENAVVCKCNTDYYFICCGADSSSNVTCANWQQCLNEDSTDFCSTATNT